MLSIREELQKLAPVDVEVRREVADELPKDLIRQWQEIAAGIADIAAGQRRTVEQLEGFLASVRGAAAETQRTASASRAYLDDQRVAIERERALLQEQVAATRAADREAQTALIELMTQASAELLRQDTARTAELLASVERVAESIRAEMTQSGERATRQLEAAFAQWRAERAESSTADEAAIAEWRAERAASQAAEEASRAEAVRLVRETRDEAVREAVPALREGVESVLRLAAAALLDQQRAATDDIRTLVQQEEAATVAREKALTAHLRTARHELEAVIEPIASTALDFREIAVGLADHLARVEALGATIRSNANAVRAAVSEELRHRHDEMERLQRAGEQSAAATADQIATAVATLDEAMRRHTAVLAAEQEKRNEVAGALLAETSTVLKQSQAILAEFERSAQVLREQASREHERAEELRAHTLDSAAAVLEKVEATLDQVRTGAKEASRELGETRLHTEVLVQAATTLEGVRGAIDEVHRTAAAAHKQVELERERSERVHAEIEQMRASLLESVSGLFESWKSDVAAHRQRLLDAIQGDVASQRDQMLASLRSEVAAHRDAIDAAIEGRMRDLTATLVREVDERLSNARNAASEVRSEQEARARAEAEKAQAAAEAEQLDDRLRATSRSMMAFLEALDDVSIIQSRDPRTRSSLGRMNERARRVLEAAGLTEIEAEGVAVDEELHEVVQHVRATAALPAGRVVKVVQRGFRSGDRVVRRAQVVAAE